MKKNIFLRMFLLLFVTYTICANEKNNNMVDSYDIIEKKLVQKEYDSIAEYYAYPVTVRLSNLKKITFANILPVYTKDRGWVRAQFLEKGDKVLYVRKGKVSYVSIRRISSVDILNVFYTYVNVHDTHNYFKESVLVHNQWYGDPNPPYVPPEENNSSGGNSGPSEAELAAIEAQEALEEVIETNESLTEIEELIAERDEEVAEYKKEVEEEQAKNEASQIGDPVLVTSGAYVQSEIDLSLKWRLSDLEITRTYNSSSKALYSMGRSWASLLDSRIIRGVTNTTENYSQSLNVLLEDLKILQDQLTNFGKRPLSRNTDEPQESKYPEINQALEIIELKYNEINRLYLSLLAQESLSKKIVELNTYVVNTDTPVQYYMIGDRAITYIDEKGSATIFEYSGNGTWLPINLQKRQYLTIRSRDKSSTLSNSGFVLYEKHGKKTWFDAWGLIEKVVDRNDNEILFTRNQSTKTLDEIETSEGRKIFFEYLENGLLKTIKSSGGEEVEYNYSGKNLSAVKDTNGNRSFFVYDSKGMLTRFTKPDESFVSFTYGNQNKQGEYLTTSTTNEEGFSEYFEYDVERNLTKYTDHSGFITYIYYDENHRTIKEIDKTGKVTKYTYDNIGNVKTMSINGDITHFTYDKRGNKIQEQYSDGSKNTWTYNAFDQITHHTDRDGKKMSITYDLRGNAIAYRKGNVLVERAEYDTTGNITKLINYKEIETHFTYDEYYNVIQKTTGNIIELFEYDKKGNIVKYIDGEKGVYTYEYGSKNIIHTTPTGLQKTYTYNNRKDLIRIEELDILTKKERVFDYTYDKRHLLQTVKQGEKTLVEYTYFPSGEVKTVIYGDKDIGDYWMKQYEYFSGASYYIHTMKFSKDGLQDGFTYTESFSIKNGGEFLVHSIPVKGESIFNFDAWGRLTAVENFVGETIGRVLSPAGRILEYQSPFNGWYQASYNAQGFLNYSSEKDNKGITYTYNPDGTIHSKIDHNENTTVYVYNGQGLLIQEKNDIGSIFYEYDAIGRVTCIIVGKINSKEYSEQYTNITYSSDSRSAVFDYGGIFSETIVFNAWGNIVQKTDGKKNVFHNLYNSLGQLVKTLDAYGNETCYEYNPIGKIAKVRFTDGTEERYSYNNLFYLQKVEDGMGIKWQGLYDAAGRLTQEKGRNLIERNYTYDSLDRITQISIGDEIIEEYRYGKYGEKIIFIDGKHNEYNYMLDSYGRLLHEKNRLGNDQYFSYDSAGHLVKKVDFNDGVQNIFIDRKRNQINHTYSDNSKSLFTYNRIGLVAAVSNATGKLVYSYNKAGLLERVWDEGGDETINYFYDKAGRVRRFTSGNRDVLYEYGKNGELLSVVDNAQRLSVFYTYDSMMRETSRIFANGVEQHTMYDDVGRVILIVEKSVNGEILRVEGYLYNELGQIHIKIDENAHITKYEYDEQGRLYTVFYPYTQAKVLFDKQEVIEAGAFVTNSMDKGETLYLKHSEYNDISNLLNTVSYAFSNLLQNLQTVWEETYTYDKNSNRLTKTTAWGTINYSYDAENRLIHSGLQGSGTSFLYDSNGNLLVRENAYNTEQFIYNGLNRMITSISSDIIKKTRVITRYAYDAFGRRNITQNEGFSAMRTLYDGLGHDIIKEAEIFPDGSFTTSYMQNGLEYQLTESSSERYLFVEEGPLHDVYAHVDDFTNTKDHYTGVKNTLYAKGDIVGMNYTENGYLSTFYFGTDILSSIRTTTTDYAAIESRYEYDAFGNPYKGDFISGLTNGYTGKPFNTATEMYNYGFRDYSPKDARFTTVDPIRDGNNWFSYVVNDPINFVDILGLFIVSTRGESKQQDFGSTTRLGNSTLSASKSGCLVVAVADGASSLKNDTTITPTSINNNTKNFTPDKSGNMDVKTAVENLGLEHDYWTKEVQGNLNNKINEANDSTNPYSILARVPWNDNGDQHWVTVQDGTTIDTETGVEYVPVKGTSENDDVENVRPDSWIYGSKETGDDGIIYIPVTEVEKIHTMKGDLKND